MFSSVLHSISNLRFAGMSVLIKVAIPPPLSVRSLPQGLAVIFSHHQVCIKKKLRAPVVPPQGLDSIFTWIVTRPCGPSSGDCNHQLQTENL